MTETLSFNGVEVPIEEFRRKCLSGDVREFPKPFMNAVAYDYLQRVVRNEQPYERWPKAVKEKLNSMGIYQENGTGRPLFDGQIEELWKDKTERLEAHSQILAASNLVLFQDNRDLEASLWGIQEKWWYRLMTWGKKTDDS